MEETWARSSHLAVYAGLSGHLFNKATAPLSTLRRSVTCSRQNSPRSCQVPSPVSVVLLAYWASR
ncbi:hypothetical protein KEM48_005136, partial [Puccinia striiformis f. sp. tritici PST-130]